MINITNDIAEKLKEEIRLKELKENIGKLTRKTLDYKLVNMLLFFSLVLTGVLFIELFKVKLAGKINHSWLEYNHRKRNFMMTIYHLSQKRNDTVAILACRR
jgi:hypothetical protein